MHAQPAPVALIIGTHVAVVGARSFLHIEATVGKLVASIGAFAAHRARIPHVSAARSATARISTAVTEDPVVARSRIVRVSARATTVTFVVGADVTVIRARCSGGYSTVIRRFIADVVALGSAGAGVTRVTTDAAAAGVCSIAVETVIA